MPISFEFGLVGIISIIMVGFISSLFCHKIDRMELK